VVGCALLVTLGSWLMYPQSFIYFGVLHGIALMLLIVRLTAHWGAWLWLLGAVAIALGVMATAVLEMAPLAPFADLFNSRALNWLGLITRKPVTEDYVPLLPWLGVMWWGVAAGARMAGRGAVYLSWQLPAALRPLATLGRWSLSYYVLHQPVMIGALLGFSWLAR